MRPIASLILACSLHGAVASAQTTELVSVSTAGANGDAGSGARSTAVSTPDGRFVVFDSEASNLVAVDIGYSDVFLRDRLTGTTEMISLDSNGAQGHGESHGPVSISDDARYVAFESGANDLTPGDTNGQQDVFVRDRTMGVTTLVSVNSLGVQGNWRSEEASISADGRFVAFTSQSFNLSQQDANGLHDVFVRDLQTGTTVLISRNPSGVSGNSSSSQPMISATGRFVVFTSIATDLVSGDTNGLGDLFVFDRQVGLMTRESVSSGGAQGTGHSFPASITPDGRYVAFRSFATNLVSQDGPGGDIFVRDRWLQTTSAVSVASGTSLPRGGCNHDSSPGISADGRFVAFASQADDLVPGDLHVSWDVFVHDRMQNVTRLVSVGSSGVQGNQVGWGVSIARDAPVIPFMSLSNNLDPADTNLFPDVYVRVLEPYSPTSTFCSGDGTSTPCPCGNDGAPGHGCASASFPGGARLTSAGLAGTSAGSDSFVLTASDIPGPGLFFHAQTLAASAIPFGDGKLCAASGITRLGVVFPVDGRASLPNPALPTAMHIAGATTVGDTRHYQCWYRSVPSLCGIQPFNLTTGLTVTWQ